MTNGMKTDLRDDASSYGTISSNWPVLTRLENGKRAGTAETVIAWAWREELPKVPKAAPGPGQAASAWERVGRFGELLSLVDAFGVNRFGAVPDFSADAWPCADARAIGDAVLAVDDCHLELPEDWQPSPELDQFGSLGVKALSDAWRRMTRTGSDGVQTLRIKPSELIIRRAVMGVDVPSMMIGDVCEQCEKSPNGKDRWFVRRMVNTVVGTNPDGSDRIAAEPVETDGYSARLGRPLPGAYRKSFLDPDPVNAIIARAEHEIWLSALHIVRETVADTLTDVVMLPPETSATPWLTMAHRPRVLPSKSIWIMTHANWDKRRPGRPKRAAMEK